jgi:hypothetical protein
LRSAFKIFSHLRLVLPMCSFPLMSSKQNSLCVFHLFNTSFVPCLYHSLWFDIPENILWSFTICSYTYIRLPIACLANPGK